MTRLANPQQQQQQMDSTMANDCKTSRRADRINNRIVLPAITSMPQFDNKSFEELNLEDCKEGNKGQNLQTATNHTSTALKSNNGRSDIVSRMIIEDDKPKSAEKEHGSIKNIGQGTQSREKISKEIPQIIDNEGAVSLHGNDLLVEFLLHCDRQEVMTYILCQSIVRRLQIHLTNQFKHFQR